MSWCLIACSCLHYNLDHIPLHASLTTLPFLLYYSRYLRTVGGLVTQVLLLNSNLLESVVVSNAVNLKHGKYDLPN